MQPAHKKCTLSKQFLFKLFNRYIKIIRDPPQKKTSETILRNVPTMSFSRRFSRNPTFISLTTGGHIVYELTNHSIEKGYLNKSTTYFKIAKLKKHINQTKPCYVVSNTFCQLIIKNVHEAGNLNLNKRNIREWQQKH